MAKKLLTLDYQDEYDFLLSGIFCAYRDYRVCFELNRVLELNLERQDDLELALERRGSTGLFPVFSYVNADDEEYFLIGNKGTVGLFATEHPRIDFFMLIKNATRYTSIEMLHKKMMLV